MQENLQNILAAIVESSDDAIVSKTLEGIITSWNKGAEKIFGYTAEEVIGKPVSILIPEDQPDEEPTILEQLRQGHKIDHYETIRVRKDRTFINISLSVSPVKDSSGKIIGASKIARDITKTKLLEREMARMGAIVESSDDAIVSKTLEGIITSWNKGAEQIFGYTTEEVVGKSITILIPKDRLDEEPAILEKLRQGQKIDHYETIRVRKDGSFINISLSVSPVKDSSGKIIGASKIARDITKTKLLEREMARMGAIVESSHDPIISLTLDGIITSWNKSAEQLYGYKNKEICGRHISMLFPRDYANNIPKILIPVYRGEVVNDFESFNITKINTFLQVSLTVFPVKDKDGEIINASMIVRDLSERKSIERERAKMLSASH